MSRLYAFNKVKQILSDANGNTREASQKVLELCLNDHNFLLGLSEPFLRGVIGHALIQAGKADEVMETPPKVLNIEELEQNTGLGMDIVRSMIDNNMHKFGTQDRSRSTLGKKTKASQSHIEALKAFVGKKSD